MPHDAVAVIWVAMAAASGALVLVRFASLRRRPEIWWWACTLTFAGISAGCALMVDEDGLNRRLGVPNLAHLLADLCIVAAGLSIAIYMAFLLWQDPRRAFIAANALVTVAVAGAMIAGWAAAPIHEVYYPTARDIPIVGGLVVYELAFHLYVLLFLAFNVIGVFAAEHTVAARDPAASLHWIVAGSVLVIGIGQLIHLAKLLPRLRGDSVWLGNLGDLVTLIGIVGTSGANTVIFLGPRLSLAQRSRRLLRELDPLASRLLAAYPQVRVPSMRVPWWQVSLRAERTIIEISDALCLLRVTEAASDVGPLPAVSHAVLDAPDRLAEKKTSVSAISVLPTPATRAEEADLLVALSQQVRADAP